MGLQYYFADDFQRFEDYFKIIKSAVRHYKKDEPVNGFGEPMNEMYYILEGTMVASIIHESGNVKTSGFYGKGYLAPLYFPGDEDIYLYFSFRAVTDLKVLVFERQSFHEYLNINAQLNIAMYEAYIKLVTLQGQELTNQLFSSGMEKLCNFMYSYLKNTDFDDNRIQFAQQRIAEIVGLNRANVAKYLKILREEEIVETKRNCIIIKNIEKLHGYCSKNT